MSSTQKSVSTTLPYGNTHENVDLWKKILFFSLIAVFILMTVMSFWFGISGDEMDMNAYGIDILHYFTSFGADKTALHPHISKDNVLMYYGGFFDLVAAMVNKISPLGTFTTRHILNAWTGFLAIFFATRISLRIKGYRMAVITTWLMFLAPFFLGHAMNNPKDIPLATGYIASIYFFIRFFDKFPKVKWTDYIAPVIALGLTIDIRVAGILLIPYMFAWLVWQALLYKEKRPLLKKIILPIIIISVLSYFFSTIFWPWALQNPLANPFKALGQLSHFKMSLRQLYEGQSVMSSNLPATYLIHNFFITNTYILIAGLCLSVIFMLGNLRKKEFPLLAFLIFVTVFPVAYIMYKHSNVYHAWRHVLFIFPSAAILSAYGLEMLLGWATTGILKYVVWALVALGFIGPISFTIRTFPNTICYYNIFAGGVKHAYYNYVMDYYYNSVKQAADWFEKNEIPKIQKKGDTVYIGSNYPDLLKQYFKDYPLIKYHYVRFYQRSSVKWDYAIFHRALIPSPQLQNGSWLIDSFMHAATIDGLPLTIISKRPSYLDYKGFQALKHHQIKQAVNDFRKYHAIDPKNEEVNGILAKYYLSVNQRDSARAFAIMTLQVAPQSPAGRMVLSALNKRRR